MFGFDLEDEDSIELFKSYLCLLLHKTPSEIEGMTLKEAQYILISKEIEIKQQAKAMSKGKGVL